MTGLTAVLDTNLPVGFYVAGQLHYRASLALAAAVAFAKDVELRMLDGQLYRVTHVEHELGPTGLRAVRVHMIPAVDGAYQPGQLQALEA